MGEPDEREDEVSGPIHIISLGAGVQSSTMALMAACVTLDKVEFSSEEDKGQPDMFGNECEGMCGVSCELEDSGHRRHGR